MPIKNRTPSESCFCVSIFGFSMICFVILLCFCIYPKIFAKKPLMASTNF